MPNIALLTCQRLPNLFETDQTLIPLFQERGIQAEAAVWNDASIDWQRFDYLIIRNTWDYYTQSDSFIAWLTQIRDSKIPMLNPSEVVLQNVHKFYLRDFANNGVRIIPTLFSDSECPLTVDDIKKSGWDKVVIKPAISAGSYETKVYTASDLNTDVLAPMLNDDRLIQPFLPEIEHGEISMIFFNGQFSHAVVKKPKEGEFRVQRQYGGKYQVFNPGSALLSEAANIIAQVPQRLLYARVDGVMIGNQFHLMELELIEPDLYFEFGEAIKVRFVEAALAHFTK